MQLLSRTVRSTGFTLIELLVAISVLSLMILLANRVFLDARKMVSRGMETSQIIASERAISDPLLKDARAMRVAETGQGGTTPGFLLIVQDLIVPSSFTDGVKFPPSVGSIGSIEDWTTDQEADGLTTAAAVFDDAIRSDQLVFFRDADGLDSLTPGSDGSPDSLANANTARVWYGHTSPRNLGTGGTPRPGLNPGEVDATSGARNDIANDLVLGRQALLLVENNNSTTYPGGNLGAGGAGPAGSNDGRFASDLGGTPAQTIDRILSLGLSDVFSLAAGFEPAVPGSPTFTLYDDAGAEPGVGKASLFRTPGWQEPALFSNPSYFDRLLTPAVFTAGAYGAVERWSDTSRLPTVDYAAAALEWAYARPGFRLQTETAVRDDFSQGIFTADDLASLHAAFVPHVADFSVEFAADFEDDLDKDVPTGEYTAGSDGFPDYEPDRDSAGNIKWYTLQRVNEDPDGDGRGNTFFNEPVTYAAPANVAAFNGTPGDSITNPCVYEIDSTTTGPLAAFRPPTGPAANKRFVFVFGHSGDDPGTSAFIDPTTDQDVVEGSGKYWPYLIRVRYRLMDGRGKYRSVDPISGEPIVGRWFEQIIPVPRPTGTF